ncbi:MAG: hypothetical protein ACR2G9_03475 [Gaiellaceae bacterium]
MNRRSLFAVGCGGSDEQLYSIPQVQEAFERTGFRSWIKKGRACDETR